MNAMENVSIGDILYAWQQGLLSKAEARAEILYRMPAAKHLADAAAALRESEGK